MLSSFAQNSPWVFNCPKCKLLNRIYEDVYDLGSAKTIPLACSCPIWEQPVRGMGRGFPMLPVPSPPALQVSPGARPSPSGFTRLTNLLFLPAPCCVYSFVLSESVGHFIHFLFA